MINGIRTKIFRPVYLSSRDRSKLNIVTNSLKGKKVKKLWKTLKNNPKIRKIASTENPESSVYPIWDYIVGRNSKNGLKTWDYIVDVNHQD